MTTEEIKKEAADIQSYLEIDVSDNSAEIDERIKTLCTYMSRSGEMLAFAKKILREQKTKEISKTILAIAKESCLSAKVQNALLDSICTEESFLVDWCERINRGCVHQIDALRSLLSYDREELRLRNTGY